jgi:hypothetical protein
MNKSEVLSICGAIVLGPTGKHLLLDQRIHDQDTFLRAELRIDSLTIPVRIHTLDNLTVLVPAASDGERLLVGRFDGTLTVATGRRQFKIPRDLAAAAAAHGLDIDLLDQSELRYALTFLSEASSPEIRGQRIDAILLGVRKIRQMRV